MSTSPSSIALVTGASAGFGAAITRRLVQRGVRVVGVARRADRLEALAAELGRESVHPLPVDLCDTVALKQAIGSLPDSFRAVDLLVNNAGLALGLAMAPQADLEDWDRVIDTNCRALVHVTRLLLPGMVERQRGHVINLGSVAGTYPYPGGNVYGASKAFVHQFSLNLRSDLHGTGVRVTCIEPGMCGGTEFSEVRFRGDRAKAAGVYAGMQPLTAEDIAGTVEWAFAQPAHVNINTIELMPVSQSFAPFQVQRQV